MSTTRDFVEPDVTVSNLLRDCSPSVLECIAFSKGGVLHEKPKKIDRKGKGREPPIGMMEGAEDLEILRKIRKWIQQRLDDFDSEKAREKERGDKEVKRDDAATSQEEAKRADTGVVKTREVSTSASDDTLIMTPQGEDWEGTVEGSKDNDEVQVVDN